jgi:hypothetical protein
LQDVLGLSKVTATAYNTSVLVKATCKYDGELFSKCTAVIRGAVFKNELQPIKGGPTALEKRATELAGPKFIAQIKKEMGNTGAMQGKYWGGGCPRTNHMGNAETGTPRTGRYIWPKRRARGSCVASQMRGRHKNGQSSRGNTGNINPREEQPTRREHGHAKRH